jgi:hypothetical protein
MDAIKKNQKVIPAQAGMILRALLRLIKKVGYPCTSGDDPELYGLDTLKRELSLHKRG